MLVQRNQSTTMTADLHPPCSGQLLTRAVVVIKTIQRPKHIANQESGAIISGAKNQSKAMIAALQLSYVRQLLIRAVVTKTSQRLKESNQDLGNRGMDSDGKSRSDE